MSLAKHQVNVTRPTGDFDFARGHRQDDPVLVATEHGPDFRKALRDPLFEFFQFVFMQFDLTDVMPTFAAFCEVDRDLATSC